MALSKEGLILVPGLLTRWARLGSGERTRHMTVGSAEA
jgi:hypothetical protein